MIFDSVLHSSEGVGGWISNAQSNTVLVIS